MTDLAIAKDLRLPIDAVTQKAAFMGRTGSGKTYGATKLAELMLDAGAQVVAIVQMAEHEASLLTTLTRQRCNLPDNVSFG